jgi:hypothetical protein
MQLQFDEEENKANQYLLDFMDQLDDWELNCNAAEYVQAVHTLQFFITMHMLQRLGAEGFSEWYGSPDANM